MTLNGGAASAVTDVDAAPDFTVSTFVPTSGPSVQTARANPAARLTVSRTFTDPPPVVTDHAISAPSIGLLDRSATHTMIVSTCAPGLSRAPCPCVMRIVRAGAGASGAAAVGCSTTGASRQDPAANAARMTQILNATRLLRMLCMEHRDRARSFILLLTP